MLLLRALRRWMRAVGFHRPIVWTFLPTPLAHDLIDATRSAADDLLLHRRSRLELAGAPADRRERGAAVPRGRSRLRHVGEAARSAPPRFSSRVHLFPVRRELRARSSACAPATEPAARPTSRRCRGRSSATSAACTSGSIRICSAAVARGMPDVTFALVGPAQTDVSRARSAARTSRCSASGRTRRAALHQGVRRRPRAVSAEPTTPPTSIRRS